MQLIRPYTDQNNIPKTRPEELWISLYAYKHGAEIWSRAFFELDINMILTIESGKETPLMSFLMLSGMHI